MLPAIAPFATFVAAIPIGVDEALAGHLPHTLKLRLDTPGGCELGFETFLRTDFNADIAPQSSSLDEVETPLPVWATGGTEEAVWSRVASPAGHVWHGADVGRKSDTWLESPTFAVSDTDPLIFTWDHPPRPHPDRGQRRQRRDHGPHRHHRHHRPWHRHRQRLRLHPRRARQQ